MADVWIHWAGGKWCVTHDAINLIEKVDEIALREVRFVVDPLGLQLARQRGKRKSHAWAVGEHVARPMLYGPMMPLEYHPRLSDQFTVGGEPVTGAAYLLATLLPPDNWLGIAAVSDPRFGPTEQRRVQQYGGTR